MRRPAPALALALVAVLVLAACPGKKKQAAPRRTTTTSTSTTIAVRPRGGSVRVGVWGMPDPAAATLGGAAVRALVLPQLFVADAAGRWQPSLVQPGSDRVAPDGMSVSFAVRPKAVWSTGAAIGAEDLRRSADKRFVAGVDGPDPDGRITVRLTMRLAQWQRLWSGVDSVSAPAPGVWGGPFLVAAVTPGLEAVLTRNDTWWGAPQPYLDEVRLVLVPDAVTARQLFQRGELDVVSPPAYTVRRTQFGDAAATAAKKGPSGWDVRLVLNPAQLDLDSRRALVASVDRRLFVDTLLADEASLLHGWDGPDDPIWAQTGASGSAAAPLKGRTVVLTGQVEEPMTPALERAVQKRVGAAGGQLELRNAEADRVEPWLAAGDFAAAVAMAYEGPSPCWTCRWAAVDGPLAKSADEGDPAAARALEQKLRDDALVLPLWRPAPFTAARPGLSGVSANGFGLSPAWNAQEWYRG